MSLLVNRFLSPKKPEQPAPTPVNLHRPLYIEKVDPKDYKLIRHIAKDWANIAQKKMASTSIFKMSERDQLHSSSLIADGIAKLANNDLPDCFPIYVCKEAVSEKVYGIAIGGQNDMNIFGLLLMTHPNNIQCNANRSEILRVKGVGTAFMKFADEECNKQGKELDFSPLSSAEPFYRKFGYKDGKKSKSVPTSKL